MHLSILFVVLLTTPFIYGVDDYNVDDNDVLRQGFDWANDDGFTYRSPTDDHNPKNSQNDYDVLFRNYMVVKNEFAKQLLINVNRINNTDTLKKVSKLLNTNDFPKELLDAINLLRPDTKLTEVKSRALFDIMSWKITEFLTNKLNDLKDDILAIVSQHLKRNGRGGGRNSNRNKKITYKTSRYRDGNHVGPY